MLKKNTWVRLLHSALKQGVMGTISCVALYALQFDFYWRYLSLISLLCQWRKPEQVEKISTWVMLLHSALKQGVMGTFSCVALYALKFDFYWRYQSLISLLCQYRKPEQAEKNSTWVMLLHSALKQGVMGTISCVALYALQFDFYWRYLSLISLLCQWRKPEQVDLTRTN